MDNNSNARISQSRERYIGILRDKVRRQGIGAMIDWLDKETDFFTAPASTRYHGAETGGLCQHSLNVYYNLVFGYEKIQKRYELPEISDETMAVVALFHDLCKIGCYKESFRNVKDDNGVWQKVKSYNFDDPLPFGHGEKSVNMIRDFISLSWEEAMAIRYHMGAFRTEDIRNLSKVYETYPIAFALAVADMEATYFMETIHS